MMRMPPSTIGIPRAAVQHPNIGDSAQRLALIVEDHDVMRDTLVDILTLIGVSTVTVDRAENVMALMRAQRPSLVLLDVELPGEMSGLDALKAIRSASDIADTPVLLITLEQNLASSVEAQAADEIMLKPVDVDYLIRVVQRLLKLPAVQT